MQFYDNVNPDNIILATDSYKLNHWNQYPKDTEGVYSYFESRKGATFPYTVFFGLQYLLKRYMVGQAVTRDDLDEARRLATQHFGNPALFNENGWERIVSEHGGRLPLRIKAVAEGTAVPTGNVLMTVENTDPECFWLTNAMESMLTHVWYSSTVATLSNYTVNMIANHLRNTAHDLGALPFMLHDFGYRGATGHEAAGIGGAAHLVNSMGTDTLPALQIAQRYYGASLENLGFSVPATEHSVMTSKGRGGESEVIDQLLDEYPSGILSVVADSYDVYRFVHQVGTTFKDRIMARDGVFVVRPDSTTPDHNTPEELTLWIIEKLWHDFGGSANGKGYRILDPHVRVLWGDGIDPTGIDKILRVLEFHSFSAENMVFGMGGGLLQKINRDTQRFAFKASAIKRDGEWHDVYKEPLDTTKTSKKGRLQLCRRESGEYVTYRENQTQPFDIRRDCLLKTVFEDGKLIRDYSFDEVRKNAASPSFG
jgi:nicotinamide phosphoribosyltransferase